LSLTRWFGFGLRIVTSRPSTPNQRLGVRRNKRVSVALPRIARYHEPMAPPPPLPPDVGDVEGEGYEPLELLDELELELLLDELELPDEDELLEEDELLDDDELLDELELLDDDELELLVTSNFRTASPSCVKPFALALAPASTRRPLAVNSRL